MTRTTDSRTSSLNNSPYSTSFLTQQPIGNPHNWKGAATATERAPAISSNTFRSSQMQFQYVNSKDGWPHSINPWKHNGNNVYHLFNVLRFAETVYVCVSYSHHNFRPCLRPLTSFSFLSYIFIFVLLLPEGRRGEAWEPSKKVKHLLPHATPPLPGLKCLFILPGSTLFHPLSLREVQQVKAPRPPPQCAEKESVS